MRVESAINTDRLYGIYGKILAYATAELLKTDEKDGMPDNILI